MTRLVEANMNAPMVAAADPLFLKRFFAVAMALYEHDEEMNPNNDPYPISRAPWPSRRSATSSLDVHASTPPAMANPMTNAHHVIHAIAAVVDRNWRVLSTKNVANGFDVVKTPIPTVASAMSARIAYSLRSMSMVYGRDALRGFG